MTNRARTLVAALALVALGSLRPAPALAHGASNGLHLHLVPGAAAPGAVIEVDADAALPIALIRIGFVGDKPLEIKPDLPAKRFLTKLTVPATVKVGTATNVVAEVEAASGKVFRASGILRVVAASAVGRESRSNEADSSQR